MWKQCWKLQNSLTDQRTKSNLNIGKIRTRKMALLMSQKGIWEKLRVINNKVNWPVKCIWKSWFADVNKEKNAEY